MERQVQYRASSTARVKKFAEGADPEEDEPEEILERRMELTQQEASDVAHGRVSIEFQADSGRGVLRSNTDGRVLAERALEKKTDKQGER